MFYEYPLTIPHSTTREAPFSQLVELARGTITWWEIQFPRGCVGLVHVRVRDEIHQVIPLNTDGDVSAEGANVSTFDSIDLADEPATLIVEGWNDDDTFDHTITFRFAVRSLADEQKLSAAFFALDHLGQWFAQMAPTAGA